MKTLTFAKRLVVIVAIAAAVSLICDFRGSLDAQEPFVNFTGRIVKTAGDVKIRKAGEKEFVTAKQGMEVGVKDEIITGKDSTADIMLNRETQRSKIRILEEANMSLMTLNLDKVTGESEILLDLAIGHIIIKTDPLKENSTFEVLTPTSMTAVRGTGFEVKVVREDTDTHR